jgi:hypothetical protein
MSKPFETLTDGKKNIVLLGEAGCGKSEIALNLAARSARRARTRLFDMDQTKPLYRARDAVDAMEKAGVEFIYEAQFFDAPTLTGGVADSLNSDCRTILDVGGNDTGARLIGGFSRLLEREDCMVLYVVNPYRPWSRDVEAIDSTLSSILAVSHLRRFHIIANPNLGFETTAEQFAAGMERAKQMLERYVPVEGACAGESIFPVVSAGTELPLLKLHLYLTYEWNT